MKRLILALLILLPGMVEGQARRAVPFRDITIERGKEYNVTHGKYGAIPNDGLCDIDEIQVAIDSINSHGVGGILFFPAGVYSFDSNANGTVTVGSNTLVSMYGAKMDQTSGGASIFTVNGGSNIVFEGGEIDGNAQINGIYNEHHHAFDIIDGFRIKIHLAYIHNMAGDGVYFADVDYGMFVHNTVISSHLADSPYLGRNGVAVVEGDHYIISDNILEGGYPANIDIEPNTGLITRDILIDNNDLIGGAYGVALTATAASTEVDCVKILGNTITAPAQVGIRIDQANLFIVSKNIITSPGQQGIWVNAGSVNFKISDNEIYNAGNLSSEGSGIKVTESNAQFIVSDNMVWSSRRDGINISGTSGSENLFVTITGNVCWGNDNLDSGQDGGIRVVYADSSYVDGNFCFDQGTSITQAYGFIFQNCDVTYFGNGNRGFGNDARLFVISTLTKEIIGQSAAYTWVVDNIAKAAGNTAMKLAGGAVSELTVPFDCQIVSLSLAASTAVTAESVTVTVMKNGADTGFYDILSSGGDVKYAYRTLLADSDSDLLLVAGDRIQIIYSTHADLAPDGSLDFSATILVKY